MGHKIPAGTGLREYDKIIVGSAADYEEMMKKKEEDGIIDTNVIDEI